MAPSRDSLLRAVRIVAELSKKPCENTWEAYGAVGEELIWRIAQEFEKLARPQSRRGI
jgi:hypothetical protein